MFLESVARALMHFRQWSLIGVLASPGFASRAVAECLNAATDSVVQIGRLVQTRIGGASVFILRTPQPVCLRGANAEDDVPRTQSIHVYSSRAAVERALRDATGRDVRIRGRPFGAVTQHHKAPIVLDAATVDAI
jgi:hypothetical protein